MSYYAEDLPYWKTGQSGSDTWIEKTTRCLENLNGQMIFEAYGKDGNGRAAFSLIFKIGAETYRIVWPVMESKTRNERAAKIQAATMMYHDIKARAVSALVLGVRTAFFSFLQLPNGMTPAEAMVNTVQNSLSLFAALPEQALPEEAPEMEVREID